MICTSVAYEQSWAPAYTVEPPGHPHGTSATGLLVPDGPGLLSHRGAFQVDKVSWGKPREIGGHHVSSLSSSSLSVRSQDPGRHRAGYISDADCKKCKGSVCHPSPCRLNQRNHNQQTAFELFMNFFFLMSYQFVLMCWLLFCWSNKSY